MDAALARGHEVTLFHRGTRPLPWRDVEQLKGDRDGGLDALDRRRWDAVVDTSGYVPRLVGASAAKLADAVGHYTCVSSVSVYRDFSKKGIAEDAGGIARQAGIRPERERALLDAWSTRPGVMAA